MEWKGWKENFKEWLEAEDMDSDRIVDDKWSVEDEEERLTASSYRTPFDLKIELNKMPGEDTDYANLSLHTGFETFKLRQNEKMYLYRKMLKMNTDSQLMKYSLGSDYDEEHIIRTDLDLGSLNKDEFEDALESTIEGTHDFFSSVVRKARLNEILGEDKSWERYITDHIIEKLSREVQEGNISMNRAVRRLTSKDPGSYDWDKKLAKKSLISFMADDLVFQVSGGEKEKDEIIERFSEILDMETSETKELAKAYLRDSLTEMVNREVMGPKEAVQWLMENWKLTQGEAYRLLDDEGGVRGFMDILEGIEVG